MRQRVFSLRLWHWCQYWRVIMCLKVCPYCSPSLALSYYLCSITPPLARRVILYLKACPFFCRLPADSVLLH
ncbi:hypothetical protein B0H63DRAFT_472572 [Podospora didyma]|uniref:Uncharacterized protein n=1 Tax=Podospora didyma TaxID=330526 RepID=A0AAE0NPF5_9PEZI|nr:hypothetical protein B0H63DRAFT_472572 [Podospora didyma]